MPGHDPVAVVVLTWNSLELLPRCLESVRAEGDVSELMVVDNGSTDGTVDYLQRKRVTHFALATNVGFAAAVNLGVRRVTAPAILVLNVDTALEPGCIATLRAELERDHSVGGVQPRILQLGECDDQRPEDAQLYSAGQALTTDGRAVEIGAGEPQRPDFLRRREVFGVCGAACLLRREVFTELGGYDESYFAFYEDVDLNVRARIAGWRFEYVPEAVVWHVGNASWTAGVDRPSAWNARLVARNRLATQVKFMPASAIPRIAVVECASLAWAASQRRLLATLKGKVAVLFWLPRLLRERHRLRREGDFDRARCWLGAD